jgi:hypothetical protein
MEEDIPIVTHGLNNFTLGVWHVNVVITTNCIAAPASFVC